MSAKRIITGFLSFTLFMSIGCQQPIQQVVSNPAQGLTASSQSSLKASIPQGPVDKLKVHLIFENEKSQGFRTTNIQQGSVAFVSIQVKDLASQNLAQTALLPVVGGQVNTVVSVPVGTLTRTASVTFFDSNQVPIGTPMRSYYEPPGGSGQSITLDINWYTTPVAETLEKLYALNPTLAQSVNRKELTGLVERFSTNNTTPTLDRYPTAIDSDDLSAQINGAGQLPDTLGLGLYKPSIIQLNTSGLQAQNLSFEIPFLSKTQAINTNGVTNVEIPPGDWPLEMTVPSDYFGSLGVQKVSLAHSETRQIALAMTPTLEIHPAVTTTNLDGLVDDSGIVDLQNFPTFKMPSEDKLTTIPSNLGTPMTFSWNPGPGQNIFAVVLTLPNGKKYTYVTNQTSWTPSTAVWQTLLSAQADSTFHTQSLYADDEADNYVDIDVQVKGSNTFVLDQGTDWVLKKESPTTKIRISGLKTNGKIFYWNNAGRVRKVPADASSAPVDYYGFGAGGTPFCSGCHSLSHNSSGQKKIAVSYTQSSIDKLRILDRANITILKDIPDGAFSTWSRNGKKLLYSTNTQLPNGRKASDLHLYDLDTDTDTLIAGADDPDFNETMPTWSTDETQIVFVRYPTSKGTVHGMPLPGTPTGLYTIPVSGGTATRLPGITEEDNIQYLYPQYSPNGNWIAYVRRDYTTYNGLPVGNQNAILAGAVPAWIQAADSSFIHVIPHGGGTPRLLSNASTGEADSMPKWSHEGNWIAFSSHRVQAGEPQIFIARFNNGTGLENAAFLLPGPTGTDNHIPAWSNTD